MRTIQRLVLLAHTDILLTKLLFLLLVIALSGCSSKPDRLPSCSPSGPGAILCLASVIATAVDTGSSKKCSDMTGDQRESCDAQVESLIKHISDASH